MICGYCGREFEPSKYRKTRQKICGDPLCQRTRQRNNLLSWQERNPLYYRIKRMDPVWRSKAQGRAKRWRIIHKDRIQAYRQSTMDQYRLYMREYMRRYRSLSTNKSPGEKMLKEV